MFLRMAVNRRDNRLFWIIGFVNFGKYVKKMMFLSLLGLKRGIYHPYLLSCSPCGESVPT